MSDNLDVVWKKLFDQRTKTLWERFPGQYRALVVETNDPLGMMRVRIRCPDLHDSSVPAEDCPWAVPAFDLGGKRAGRFVSPCIGDWVWIAFERGHAYGLVWTGFATPTRRKYYTYQQISQITPLSVNDTGIANDRPHDYDADYLPKDGRPMSHGWVDRYGNMDVSSAVGYYPIEHANPPPPPDQDAVQHSKFQQKQAQPVINSPDKKYMARVTKYGNMLILADQGYHWHKEGELGEFSGNFADDEEFETNRWLSLQKLLNEGEPAGDHRRIVSLSRYGSRIEIRDTGWAQQGPTPSKSRADEFGPAQTLSKETENDYRWIKIRTKGGMLFQAYDQGFDPDKDEFIKRPLVDEQGDKSEREDLYWTGRDSRWMRMVTRYGYKFVLDDRGSDSTKADQTETPYGNGALLKGRRTPSAKGEVVSDDPRGFYFEFNENDLANHTSWGSPLGQTVEMNDRYQYLMIAATMGPTWAAEWMGLKENEFIRKPTMLADPEKNSYHLKLDHENEYLRLKTRGGNGPIPIKSQNPSGVSSSDLQQGMEARDGQKGQGPWVEVVDSQHRGLWLSRQHNIGIWRAKTGIKMYQWLDDDTNTIVIHNAENSGKIQIFCKSAIEIIGTDKVAISGQTVEIVAERAINMQAAGTRFSITDTGVRSNKEYYGKQMVNKPGGNKVTPPVPIEVPTVVEPDDRAQTYNGPFEECPIGEVQHGL